MWSRARIGCTPGRAVVLARLVLLVTTSIFATAFGLAVTYLLLHWVWRDLLAEEFSCGLHRIERLMRLQALKARPGRRRLPPDLGERQAGTVAAKVLDRSFEAAAPNRKWIADFTYVRKVEGRLYVAPVIDLFSRRAVGWLMSAAIDRAARN